MRPLLAFDLLKRGRQEKIGVPAKGNNANRYPQLGDNRPAGRDSSGMAQDAGLLRDPARSCEQPNWSRDSESRLMRRQGAARRL